MKRIQFLLVLIALAASVKECSRAGMLVWPSSRRRDRQRKSADGGRKCAGSPAAFAPPFFKPDEKDIVQQVEINRGRPEARCLIRLDAPAEKICFPAGEQAARLTRFVDRKQAKPEGVETEWLITSRPLRGLSAAQMSAADRRY